MNYSMLEAAGELADWQTREEIRSIYQAMQHLSDGRGAKGKRYSLALLFTYILLGRSRK